MQAGAMNFYMADMYGYAHGFSTTQNQSIPDNEDQQALVDESETIKDKPHNVDPAKQKHIFVSVGVILAIIIFLSYSS